MSIDGREENNDKHGGRAASRGAIKAGVANRIPKLVTSSTLTRDVMHEWLAALARDLAVRAQYSIPYNPEVGRASDMRMSKSEARAAAETILDLKRVPVYYSENVLLTTIHWPVAHN